ncbi:MAG: hypothetical protein IKZ88_01690 [Neisseriaceae bacterium]|nr:hypothetical protein [Neisseriaceae bacterium]
MSSGLVLPCGKTDFLIRTTLCTRPYLKYSSCRKAGHNIVGKLQNNNALVRLAVLVYTVCGSPPFILLNFTDYNCSLLTAHYSLYLVFIKMKHRSGAAV